MTFILTLTSSAIGSLAVWSLADAIRDRNTIAAIKAAHKAASRG